MLMGHDVCYQRHDGNRWYSYCFPGILHSLTASHHFVMDADANAASAVHEDGNDLLNVPQSKEASKAVDGHCKSWKR